VPKFMKSAKYEQTLKNYDFESIAPRPSSHGPERSVSRADR
jgi:GTPase-activating protein SST2